MAQTYEKYPEGRIIAVVGTSKCGKSFLTGKLADHYKAAAIYEGDPSQFPERIQENLSLRASKEISDIERNLRNLETILWFRTERIKDYKRALDMKEDGRYVVMDTFWMTNQTYIPAMLEGFERDLANEVARLDRLSYTHPDATVLLNVSDDYIKMRVKEDAGRNGRKYETTDDDIRILCETGKEQKKFFKENTQNFVCVDRDKLDFSDEKDFGFLISELEKTLYAKANI